MQGLKDKLIEAGLVPEDYRPGESPEQRSARLNREQVEKRSRIEALVTPARIAPTAGANTFFFSTRSGKLRRLVLDDGGKGSLERGEWAVVEWPNQPDFPWAVVPREVAEKVLALDRAAVRFYVRSEAEQLGIEKSEKAEA